MSRKYLPRSGPNFLGLLVFLIVIIFGFFAALQVIPEIKSGQYGKADRFNFAIAGNNTALVSLNILKKSAVFLKFPDNLYMSEVAFGYGKYSVSSVYSAGQLDRRGGETLSQTLAEYVGVPLSGYVYLKENGQTLKKVILSKDFLVSQSNISFLDKLQIMYLVFNLRDDKIKEINLDKYSSPLVLADGSVASSLEKDELDNFFDGLFLENSLQDEDLRLEVINTTKVFGLGSRVSRTLSNMGIAVVNVDSSSLLLPNCKIEASPKALNSKTVLRIAGIYGCSVSKTETESRAEVRVFVGVDYAKKIEL